jgi:hypothetical protein
MMSLLDKIRTCFDSGLPDRKLVYIEKDQSDRLTCRAAINAVKGSKRSVHGLDATD